MKTDGFKKYSKRNTEEFKDYMVTWRKENKDKISVYSKKYSEEKTHIITKKELSLLYAYCKGLCMYCGMSELEAKDTYGKKLFKDHFYNEGSNGIDNCILCCNGCSSSKRDHDFEEWYIENNPVYSEERYKNVLEWIHSFK